MFDAGKLSYDLFLSKDYVLHNGSKKQITISKKIETNNVTRQSFTILTTILTGTSQTEEHQDLRCISWKVSFDVTAELEENVNITIQNNICADYNRISNPQRAEDQCTANKYCKYAQLDEFCSPLKTIKVNKTHGWPYSDGRKVQRTLEIRNLKYVVYYSNTVTEVKIDSENIHCLDWAYLMGKYNSTKFTINKARKSINFHGEKCQEFIETISPKSLDGQMLKPYDWVSIPSVGAPNIEQDTLRFDIKEPQFQGCEPNTTMWIICYYANGTGQKLGPFKGNRIKIKSLKGEDYEKCYALIYMNNSGYKQTRPTRARVGNPFSVRMLGHSSVSIEPAVEETGLIDESVLDDIFLILNSGAQKVQNLQNTKK